jgi:uncharacterized protein YcbX
MRIGKVVEIWRYPVKSMVGGQLGEVAVASNGIPGDRGWAVRDEKAGEIRGAKKFPALMRCSARYLTEPGEGPVPPAEITLPDGGRVRSDSPEANARLSALLGKPVTLWPLRPATDLEHYRRHPDHAEMVDELKEMFARTEDEPFPDLSAFPKELFEYTSPLGTYFDAFPVHLVSDAWLAELARHAPAANFDRRRFRPNFFIDTEGKKSGCVEEEWLGREVRIGTLRLKIELPVVRCSMTTQPQEDLPHDPTVLRTIVRQTGQNVGVYASVVEPGRVRVGDAIEI